MVEELGMNRVGRLEAAAVAPLARIERELARVLLQLDQLRHAERSPHHRTLEDDDRGVTGAVGVEVNALAALVREAEVGEPLADRR